MSSQNKNCLRCQTPMEDGYLQDIGYGITIQTRWNRGVPEQRNFLGMTDGIKYRKDGIAMTASRCPKCGFVELNALAEK